MRLLLPLAALSGALAVAAGAFGAHGASGAAADWLKTGAQYQLIHAVAALAALVMSTGMASLGEVEAAVTAVRAEGNEHLILLQCVSNYPADPADTVQGLVGRNSDRR